MWRLVLEALTSAVPVCPARTEPRVSDGCPPGRSAPVTNTEPPSPPPVALHTTSSGSSPAGRVTAFSVRCSSVSSSNVPLFCTRGFPFGAGSARVPAAPGAAALVVGPALVVSRPADDAAGPGLVGSLPRVGSATCAEEVSGSGPSSRGLPREVTSR